MRHWPGETKPKIVKAAAGVSFSVMLSEEGKRECCRRTIFVVLVLTDSLVYVVGSGEHGQLGNGARGNTLLLGTRQCLMYIRSPVRISRSDVVLALTVPLVLIKAIQDKVITDVSCGHQQHNCS